MQLQFDARQVKPQEAFEPLPAGWYNAKIVNSEPQVTKANDGAYLKFEIEILDGEYKGRKVFDRINKWAGINPDTGVVDPGKAQAREIADRQLSAYCHATGVFLLQDSSQLHNIPIKIKLNLRQDVGYEPSNDVKAVKHIQDAATPATTVAAPAAMPASAAPFGAPTAPNVAAPSPAPFGMNPALPPQPAPASAWAPPAAAPVAQPAPQAQPWGAPAAAPQFPPQTQPMPQAAPAWAPPAQPAAPAPASGPVPPWRR